MPQPMPFPDDRGAHAAPDGYRPAPPRAAPPIPRSPDDDRSGRPLAVRLPEWDLLPPTEFLNRGAR